MRDLTKDEPAFPAEGGSDSGLHAHPGISMRDYFAAKALPEVVRALEEATKGADINMAKEDHYLRGIAATCYDIADAMLEARKK